MVYEAIDTDKVIDHLNTMVELELALDDAFEGAVLAMDDRLAKEKLVRYRESTRRHRDLSIELLAGYGSAPQPKGVLSSLAVDIEVGLTGGRKRQKELRRLQDLSVVVLLSRSNWEIVGPLLLAVGDQVTAERIEGVVLDKNEQLDWLRKQIVDLGQRTLVRRRLSRSI